MDDVDDVDAAELRVAVRVDMGWVADADVVVLLTGVVSAAVGELVLDAEALMGVLDTLLLSTGTGGGGGWRILGGLPTGLFIGTSFPLIV